MDLPLYQIDAFVTDRPFSGSPAAVIPLDHWIEDGLMQGIALENNLSETVFLVPEEDAFRIRWFTPTMEVDLCGHATLASAHVLYQLGHRVERFFSLSGDLAVRRDEDRFQLDFPARPGTEWNGAENRRISTALGATPSLILRSSRDWLLVFEDEEAIQRLQPDFSQLAEFTGQGFIVTARATGGYDFCFRYFAPALGLNEDPATGSVQCTLVPYWADRLNKLHLTGRQDSNRGAEFFLEWSATRDRVYIAGRCRPYMEGTIHV